MNRILINGDRTYLPVDGMNRVLLETVRSLDALVKKDKYILVIPSDADGDLYEEIKDLRNIKVRKTMLPHFRFWTLLFIDLPGVLPHTTAVNFTNRNSVFGGGINMLHDIIPLRFYKDRSRRYLRRIMRLLNTSDALLVPSAFTRDEITETLKCDHEIRVIHLGWQHYSYIQEDDGIFSEYPNIEKGLYFFSLSSVSPHKNLKFVYEAARRNPSLMFVVTGAMNRGYGFDHTDLRNLVFTGRISDRKAKALMMNCRAFIFPSLYEGAGLPPLEALSCNVPVLAADIEVIHEYCGDSVHYFDPYNYDLNFEEVLKKKASDPGETLGQLSWDKTAEELKSVIERGE